jgi:hypothetical protein
VNEREIHCILTQITEEYGIAVLHDVARMGALLNDLIPEDKTAQKLIMLSVQNRIPDKLLRIRDANAGDLSLILRQQAELLQKRELVTEEHAIASVRIMAALLLDAEAELIASQLSEAPALSQSDDESEHYEEMTASAERKPKAFERGGTVWNFLKGVGAAAAASMEQRRREIERAYEQGMRFSDDRLIRDFKQASGTKNTGYAKALEERGFLYRDDEGKYRWLRKY